MAATKTIQVSERTHHALAREAERRGTTVDALADEAIRTLVQAQIGRELSEPLTDKERRWLDAPIG